MYFVVFWRSVDGDADPTGDMDMRLCHMQGDVAGWPGYHRYYKGYSAKEINL